MKHILEQIRATFDSGIWYPVVSSVLMLPDACGAVEYWGKNVRSRRRYVDWYDKWVLPHFTASNVIFDGEVVYIVRNAMMHETTGLTRGDHGFDRVLFVPPNRKGVLHFNLMQPHKNGETGLHISIEYLMEAVFKGVDNWLTEVAADGDRRRSDAVGNIIQYRPNGHPPFSAGDPVVS